MSEETQPSHAVGARQSAAASAAQQPPSRSRQDALPALARAAAPQIVAAEKPARQEQSSVAPPEPGKDAPQEASQPAQASSSATPAPAALRGPQAAPFNSDAPSSHAVQASWQSRVLSHLAHFKRYPLEARQRRRTGEAWVRFQLGRDGKLLASELVASSGAVLLDREALQVLERAQPLPVPPEAMLRQGTVTVTLPVSFQLDAEGRPGAA
nr:TonB family protein [Pseudoduganella violacea]